MGRKRAVSYSYHLGRSETFRLSHPQTAPFSPKEPQSGTWHGHCSKESVRGSGHGTTLSRTRATERGQDHEYSTNVILFLQVAPPAAPHLRAPRAPRQPPHDGLSRSRRRDGCSDRLSVAHRDYSVSSRATQVRDSSTAGPKHPSNRTWFTASGSRAFFYS